MASSRFLGWLIPCLCIGGAAFVVFRQSSALQDAQVQHDKAVKEVESADKLHESMLAMGQQVVYAAVPQSQEEQTQFLTDLKARAAENNLVITNWTTQVDALGTAAPTSTTTTGGQAPQDAQAVLLKGLTRIGSNVTLSGDYKSIQTFLNGLINSHRLYTLSKVNWMLYNDTTRLTLTISRYVSKEKSEVPLEDNRTPTKEAPTQGSATTAKPVESVSSNFKLEGWEQTFTYLGIEQINQKFGVTL